MSSGRRHEMEMVVEDGQPIQNWQCSECHFVAINLTEVAGHVVANQYEVRDVRA